MSVRKEGIESVWGQRFEDMVMNLASRSQQAATAASITVSEWTPGYTRTKP